MEKVLAKDIKECEDCLLYEHDCTGGAKGTPNGYKEPPCCSWNKGLVPSFDGKTWRLHGYAGKILWKGKIERSGE